VKSSLSKTDFIRLTVSHTLGEYLRTYGCNPTLIKKAQARCISDAQMLADEMWGEVKQEPNLLNEPKIIGYKDANETEPIYEHVGDGPPPPPRDL
jgi:hypothetical protein